MTEEQANVIMSKYRNDGSHERTILDALIQAAPAKPTPRRWIVEEDSESDDKVYICGLISTRIRVLRELKPIREADAIDAMHAYPNVGTFLDRLRALGLEIEP